MQDDAAEAIILLTHGYPKAKWRVWIRTKIVANPWFGRVVMLLIALNCVSLAMDVPAYTCDVQWANLLEAVELFFTVAFAVELMINCLGLGVFEYVRNPWNRLDAVVAVSCVVLVVVEAVAGTAEPFAGQSQGCAGKGDAFPGISALRAVRVFRPLRVVTGIPEIRIIVNSLLYSFRMLLDVLMLYLLMLITFGIVALTLWRGKLRFRCVDAAGNFPPDGEEQVCRFDPGANLTLNTGGPLLEGYQCPWGYYCSDHYPNTTVHFQNPNRDITSFDNIAHVFLTIFVMVTTEWWTEVMYFVADASTPATWIYFVVLLFLGSFFVINLSLVIINDAFQKNVAKEKEEKQQNVEEQPKLLDIVKERLRRLVPSGCTTGHWCGDWIWLRRLRQRMCVICSSQRWSNTILFVIILNTVILAVEYYGMPEGLKRGLDWGNFVCTVIFALECAFRVFALGWVYLNDNFNIFDFVVVSVSIPDLFSVGGQASGASALRIVRLLRIFKLVRRLPSLNRWSNILLQSAKEASWLTLLLLLVMFIYALLGMQFFAGEFCCLVDADESCVPGPQCEGRPRQNFDYFYSAMLAVFQILSGEDWNALMYDGVQATSYFAAIYYVTCFIIGNYIVLNLFIAVLLNNNAITDHAEDEDVAQGPRQQKRLIDRLVECFTMKRPKLWTLKRPATMPMPPNSAIAVLHNAQWNAALAEMEKDVSSNKSASNRNNVSFDASSLGHSSASAAHKQHMQLPQPDSCVQSPQPPTPEAEAEGEEEGKEAAPITQPSLDPPKPTVMQSAVHKIRNISIFSASSLPIKVTKTPESSGGMDLEVAINISPPSPPKSIPSIVKLQMLDLYKLAASKQPQSHVPRLWVSEEERGEDAHKGDHLESVRQGNLHGLRTMKSRGCFGCLSRARKVLKNVVTHTWFESIVLGLILLSSVTLAMEQPMRPPDEPLAIQLVVTNTVLVVCFTIECALKIAAMGFIMPKKAYLRDNWNVLDFTIVVVSWISVFRGTRNGVDSIDHMFKMMRVLRPLRFINRSKGMKVVVDALVHSIRPLGNVMLICSFLFMIFAILGTQLFMGRFFRCEPHPDFADDQATAVYRGYNQTFCEQEGGIWKNPSVYTANFDNIFRSCLTLFEVATLEGWVDVMLNAKDATEEGQAPIRDNHPEAALYFVAFIMVGSFFVPNLIVGVLIDNYYVMRSSLDENFYLTASQKDWLAMQKVMMNSFQSILAKPEPPKTEYKLRIHIFNFVQHPSFDHMVTACVCLNTMVLCLVTADSPTSYNKVVEYITMGFSGLFTIEAILKMVGYGLRGYFKNGWNQFDFAIVLLSDVDAVFLAFPESDLGEIGNIFRVLRVIRILRVLKVTKGIRTLIRTLFSSLPSLVNVASLLFLLFFLFALLGMQLFGKVRRQDNLNRHANFEGFGHAMLLMIRISTGEAWNAVMAECTVQEPFCSPQLGECGSPTIAAVYYVLFMLLGMYMLLNLFIAVILDNFSEISGEEDSEIAECVQLYHQKWMAIDVSRSLYMDANKVPEFLRTIGDPLGVAPEISTMQLLQKCAALNVTLRGRGVHYQDLLVALAEDKFGVELPQKTVQALEAQWASLVPMLSDSRFDPASPSGSLRGPQFGDEAPTAAELERYETSVMLAATLKLQAIWRGRQSRQAALDKYADENGLPKNGSQILVDNGRTMSPGGGTPRDDITDSGDQQAAVLKIHGASHASAWQAMLTPSDPRMQASRSPLSHQMQIPVATIPYNPPHYIADDVPIPNYLNFTVHNRPPPEPELYPTQYGPLPLPPPLLDYDGYAISDRLDPPLPLEMTSLSLGAAAPAIFSPGRGMTGAMAVSPRAAAFSPQTVVPILANYPHGGAPPVHFPSGRPAAAPANMPLDVVTLSQLSQPRQGFQKNV